jgi:hypothetical protein
MEENNSWTFKKCVERTMRTLHSEVRWGLCVFSAAACTVYGSVEFVQFVRSKCPPQGTIFQNLWHYFQQTFLEIKGFGTTCGDILVTWGPAEIKCQIKIMTWMIFSQSLSPSLSHFYFHCLSFVFFQPVCIVLKDNKNRHGRKRNNRFNSVKRCK